MLTRNLVFVGAVATASLATGAAPANADSSDRPITVMTQNMDTGTDFAYVLGATDGASLLAGATATYQEVVASDMPGRAAKLAEVIQGEQPDLIMLEEVTTLRTGAFMQPPATTVVYDQLQLLMTELGKRGLSYAPVAVLQEADFEVPSSLGINIRTTDHDVLLARTDLHHGDLDISNVTTTHFAAQLSFGSPALGQVTIPRGYIMADVKTRGRTYRVAGTHLESYVEAYQVAQAGELVAALSAVKTPVVLLGDFNANAETGPDQHPTVANILAAGYSDDWHAAHPNDPGYTWPLFREDPPGAATPVERIDLIFSHGDVDVLCVKRTGTAAGRWPSDHAGVAATLDIGKPSK